MNGHLQLRQISLAVWLLPLVLAAGWLLPNHYPPWMAFHSNAWVAGALLLLFLYRHWHTRQAVGVDRVGVFLLATAALPWLHHATGLLPLRSEAFLVSLYLAGAALAYLLARSWNQTTPMGAATPILAAMAVAALLSTGIATYQWLGLAQDLDFFDIWLLAFPEGTRPYANMGQTNQLATLLLCGLLGIAWGWKRRWITAPVALLAAGWLVWGVALTESRTAMLTLLLATAAVTLIRPFYLSRPDIRAVQGVAAFYLLCLAAKPALASALGLHMPLTLLQRSAGELRWALWQMSLEATLGSPWWGYGWGRSNAGYFEVFDRYRDKLGNTYFEQSHNLVLDLALWVGWPLALLLMTCAGVWLYRAAQRIRSAEGAMVLGALLVMLVHAMLEFPLHYGYFLWPFFVLAGALSDPAQPAMAGAFRLSRTVVLAVLLGLGATTVLVVRDYLRIEQAFTELRFQVARVGTGHDETLPKTLLLTDWPDVIALSRSTPQAGMSAQEIAHWQALMMYNTSPLALRKVIGAYRLNGHEAEAQAWAVRACWLLSEKACRGLLDEWPKPGASAESAKDESAR